VKFTDIGLHPSVMSGVEASGFTECTPIQAAAIPHIITGRDVAGLAQTGTGKTAAFVLPLIHRIVSGGFKDWRKPNFILVLVPTRELAEQVYENVSKFGSQAGVKATAIYGGTGYESQKAALRSGVEFVVATPGRLIDLYKEHLVDLAQVRAIVFDEADRMFDMGFKDDMKYVLQRVAQDRQFLVFSATLNFDVLNTAYEFGANPVEVNVSRDQAKAENVVDEIFHVGQGDKPKFLLSLLLKHKPKQVIVFSNFKHNVERIAQFLSLNGVPALGISSLISQSQRTRVMEVFRAENNDRNVLVATDVAARGLDIKGVDLVINFELPDDAENYVHRIGRTGRAGAEGRAYSLVSDRDVEALQRIETYLGHKVAIGWIEDTELVKDFKDLPRENDRGDRKRDHHAGGGSGPRRDFSRGDKRHSSGGPNHQRRERSGPRAHEGGRHPRDRHAQDRHRSGSSSTSHPHRGPRPYADSQSKSSGPQQRQAQTHAKSAGSQSQHPRDRSKEQRPQGGGHGFRHRPSAAGTHAASRGVRPNKAAAPKSLLGSVGQFFKNVFGGPKKNQKS
jgi:superfamily II DNA/RNA helicase